MRLKYFLLDQYWTDLNSSKTTFNNIEVNRYFHFKRKFLSFLSYYFNLNYYQNIFFRLMLGKNQAVFTSWEYKKGNSLYVITMGKNLYTI